MTGLLVLVAVVPAAVWLLGHAIDPAVTLARWVRRRH